MPVLRLRLAAADRPRRPRPNRRAPRCARGRRQPCDRRDDHLLRPAAQPARTQARSAARGRHPTVADPQIRHRGTLGGGIAHADPAGDLCAPVLALEATLTAAGPSGRRSIPVSEFFVDYFTTALQPDEILTEVRIPKRTDWAAHYEKLNRVAQAWSIVAVAATVAIDGGVIRQARVALTNMAPVPVRARGVEEALIGQAANPELIRAAAEHAAEGTEPHHRRQRRSRLSQPPCEGPDAAGRGGGRRRLASFSRRKASRAARTSPVRPRPD